MLDLANVMQHNSAHTYYDDIPIPAQNLKDPIVRRRNSHTELELNLTSEIPESSRQQM